MWKKIKSIINEIIYIFLNYFVCNIPINCVRIFFYKLFGMKIGKGSKILMKTQVVSPWKITLGDHVYVNEWCYLDGRGGISIGDNTTVALYSKIITGFHDVYSENFDYKELPVKIGDNCAIFTGTIVLPGVEIEDKAIFAAGSVVKRQKYEGNFIYGGNPVSKIKNRNLENNYSQDEWKVIFR